MMSAMQGYGEFLMEGVLELSQLTNILGWVSPGRPRRPSERPVPDPLSSEGVKRIRRLRKKPEKPVIELMKQADGSYVPR